MKNKHARYMVLEHDTLSECALQMYEVSLKYLYSLMVIKLWSGQDFVTYRQPDRQTGTRGKTICLPTLPGGRHNLDL